VSRSRAVTAVVAGAWAAAACAPLSPRVTRREPGPVVASDRGLSDWANISSNKMVEKYGPPDRVETQRLVWDRHGPWKRISVWDGLGFLDGEHVSANVEGAISYPVPAGKRADLASFSRGLTISADGAELSARSTGEERNFLMLNIADEIVTGHLSPEEGRETYLRTLQLAESGKSSPSMERLLFQSAAVDAKP
jgi:hypothetical protein